MTAFAAAGGDPSAITTAFIALGGAIIGGLLTSGGQLLVEHLRAKREDIATRRELKIATRMMRVDLSRAWSNIAYAARTGTWWETPGLAPRMSESDRRLTIGALTAEEFDKVDRAQFSVDYWYGEREREIQNGKDLRPRHDPDRLRSVLKLIDKAAATLREISGDPETVDDGTDHSESPEQASNAAEADD